MRKIHCVAEEVQNLNLNVMTIVPKDASEITVEYPLHLFHTQNLLNYKRTGVDNGNSVHNVRYSLHYYAYP